MHFSIVDRDAIASNGQSRSLRIAPLFVVALLAASCTNASADDAVPVAEPPPAAAPELEGHRVEVAVVNPSSRSLTLSVPGEVQGYRDASLAAALGGYIESVMVEEGDRVKKGQALVAVDQATHGARLARQKLELQVAERELSRAQSLQGTIAKAEIDAAEDRVELARASVKELVLNAGRAVVRAPFEGHVVRVDAEVGEVAPPGAVLVRLVQLQPVKVSVSLSDRDIALAKVGSKASIQLDARSGAFEGLVTSISRAADMKTRSFEAIIEVSNEQETLLPGMIANVTLQTGQLSTTEGVAQGSEDKPQLIISQDWIVTRRDGVGVFVEKDGVAQWRSVHLGDILRKQVVVDSGLEAGDALIIAGHRELVDGDKVLVHRRGRCCQEGRVSFSE